MTLDRNHADAAYVCGRLFAALERAQTQALPGLNATIRDRYFGAASATPASVFPLLLRNAQNHLASLRKEYKSGRLEAEIEEIVGMLGTALPKSLILEQQGRFVIGYYHQRQSFFEKRTPAPDEEHVNEEAES